ncbi:MAG TPA: hypothetical protein PLA18_04100 [Deltaproteobacteria bacterium]|nr:hypothetical protein [Deltaproteobacteria bacterium]
MKKHYVGLVVMVAFLIGVVVLPGCAEMKDQLTGTPASKAAQSAPRYLDFNDILIPGDLTKIAKESYITNGQGRLVLSGKVYADSLAQYFLTSMYSEGWTTLNQYKYQGSIKLFFKKPERFASILIQENPLGTWVEIWEVPQEKI